MKLVLYISTIFIFIIQFTVIWSIHTGDIEHSGISTENGSITERKNTKIVGHEDDLFKPNDLKINMTRSKRQLVFGFGLGTPSYGYGNGYGNSYGYGNYYQGNYGGYRDYGNGHHHHHHHGHRHRHHSHSSYY